MSTQFPSNSPQILVGVQVKTADYAVALTDHAQLLIMNSSLARTFTLLATPPSRNGWFVYLQNIGTGACTIARNGNNIDGAAANIILAQNTGILLASDGATYYTERGLASGIELTANKDAASGYAGLDANTKLKLTEQATVVDARTSTSEAVADSDRAKLVTFSNTAATAATIAQAGASSNFVAGWYCDLVNENTGVVTLTPTTSTIDGQTTLILQRYEGVRIVSDGSNYFTIKGQPTIDTPADADVLTYVVADKRWESKGIGTIGGANASQLRGKNISAAAPTDQQILRWSVTDNQYDLVYADGLLHGDMIFGVDAGFIVWKDKFFRGGIPTSNTTGGSNLGELGWDSILGTGVAGKKTPPPGGFLSAIGVGFKTGTTANSYGSIYWPGGSIASSSASSTPYYPLPLLDYPGWKMVWVFGFSFEDGPANVQSSFAQKQFYLGLCPQHTGSGSWNVAGGSGSSGIAVGVARPPYFIGLRYDTDPGKSMALTSVATVSGGTTVYTGTALSLTTNELIGSNVTITGFTNGANNGTFECISNTGTTMTLINANGIAETHAATATTPALSDANFVFEVVNNHNVSQTRINNQGTTSNTGIAPSQFKTYRFEMLCNAAGQIVMTLSGNGSTFTHTFTGVPQTTTDGALGGSQITLDRQNGLGDFQLAVQPTSRTSCLSIAIGTKVTISNAPVGKTFYNGTFTVLGAEVSVNNAFTYALAGASDSSSNTGVLLTYYPGLNPYFAIGNDSQASPSACICVLDFFGLIWNTGIQTTPGAIDATQAHYGV